MYINVNSRNSVKYFLNLQFERVSWHRMMRAKYDHHGYCVNPACALHTTAHSLPNGTGYGRPVTTLPKAHATPLLKDIPKPARKLPGTISRRSFVSQAANVSDMRLIKVQPVSKDTSYTQDGTPSLAAV